MSRTILNAVCLWLSIDLFFSDSITMTFVQSIVAVFTIDILCSSQQHESPSDMVKRSESWTNSDNREKILYSVGIVFSRVLIIIFLLVLNFL
jgi:hypothetical protein